MKKIGLIYGRERSFPKSLIERINKKKPRSINAEAIELGPVEIGEIQNYDIIFDRVSCEVPFYNSVLKSAVINGIKVVNNPFLNSNSDGFFYNALAKKLGISVPNTVILPSKEHPDGTTSDTMSNLIYPLDWEKVFDYIGFPAYLKPCSGNMSYNKYKVYNPRDFYSAYDLTGKQTMIYQSEVNCENYFIAYVIDKKHVRVISYNPSNPVHLRFNNEKTEISDTLFKQIEEICLKITKSLNLDFNAIELAVNGSEPQVIEFLSNADIEQNFLFDEDYEWIVETTANFLIESTEKKPNSDCITIIGDCCEDSTKAPAKTVKRPTRTKAVKK